MQEKDEELEDNITDNAFATPEAKTKQTDYVRNSQFMKFISAHIGEMLAPRPDLTKWTETQCWVYSWVFAYPERSRDDMLRAYLIDNDSEKLKRLQECEQHISKLSAGREKYWEKAKEKIEFRSGRTGGIVNWRNARRELRIDRKYILRSNGHLMKTIKRFKELKYFKKTQAGWAEATLQPFFDLIEFMPVFPVSHSSLQDMSKEEVSTLKRIVQMRQEREEMMSKNWRRFKAFLDEYLLNQREFVGSLAVNEPFAVAILRFLRHSLIYGTSLLKNKQLKRHALPIDNEAQAEYTKFCQELAGKWGMVAKAVLYDKPNEAAYFYLLVHGKGTILPWGSGADMFYDVTDEAVLLS